MQPPPLAHAGAATESLLAAPAARPFNLSRWFAIVGLLSIGLLGIACALLLSRLISQRMLEQEGVLTMQFVQSIIEVEHAAANLESYPHQSTHAGSEGKIDELLEHFAALPDVLRANLYSREHRMLWSSDRSLTGLSFPDNPELDEAFKGHVEVSTGHDAGGEHAKAEHVNLRSAGDYFIEIYMPIWDRGRQRVVGVVEIYRTPGRLQKAIEAGQRIIWTGALVAAALLYLALISLVRRADNVSRAQQRRLLEAETLAAVGEMASAVAHGIRNPLAAIRSSAELAQVGSEAARHEASEDIISQVDRLEEWIRMLLSYAHPVAGQLERVDLRAMVADCMRQQSKELERRAIATSTELPPDLPPVRGDPLLLGQVIGGVIANAMEAIGSRGRIAVSAMCGVDRVQVVLRIADSGPGMTAEQVRRAFEPFYTTKARGLGLGLPLARRIVQRYGGSIAITSAQQAGTTVEVVLPAA